MGSRGGNVTRYFQNKFVVIAGGSEGIGLSMAVQLVSQGADVVIGSRDPLKREKALALMQAQRVRDDQLIDQIPLDVLNFKTTHDQLDALLRQHRTPDVFINAAGFARPGYFETLEMDHFEQMMALNYFSLVHTAKIMVPAMRRAGKGHIVNISSMAGYLGLFGYSGYCGSKYAVLGFSDALRHELKPYGIHVSVVCPPSTRTPGLETEAQFKPKEVWDLEKKVKTADPEDVARVILKEISSRRFMINPTLESKFVYLASRWAPAALLDYFLRRPSVN
jgi:3-dehydrosphinganine reductase